MNRIILTAVPEDFDSDKDILLGPWSLIGKEDMHPHWVNYNIEPDPFNSADEIAFHAKQTTDFAESYMNKLSIMLNKVNNTEYSLDFWRQLVFPWLLSLIQTAWERQLRINKILEKYSDLEVKITLSNDIEHWRFKDTIDHQQNGLINHHYNHWLFSRLLEQRVPANWNIEWIETESKTKDISAEKRSLERIIKDLYSYIFLSSTVYGMGKLEAIFFEILVFIKSLFISRTIKNKQKPQKTNFELDWNLDLDKVVQKSIPLCFTEINNYLNNKLYHRKLYLVGPIVWYDEKEKVKLAEAVENGSKIIVTQHGGSYGTSKAFCFPPALEYNHFKFISWGWKKQEDYQGNIIPLPSPLLSKYKYKYKKINNNVILVSTLIPLYWYRISSIAQANQLIEYRNARINFIDSINIEVLKNLLFRSFHYEVGTLSDKEYVERRYPDIKILEGNLHKESMRCGLLVVDHPDTTLNIALAANIPTVCFWDKDIWSICRQAEPYFQTLRDVGILFNNGREAAEKVNEIWDDVTGWWEQPHIQKAREEWCWQYARTSKNWRWEWIKAIWKL